MIFEGDGDEISRHSQAIRKIHRWMESETNFEEQTNFESVIEFAVPRLLNEFDSILAIQIGLARARIADSTTYSTSLMDSTTTGFDEEEYSAFDSLPSEQEMYYLRTIADKMNFVRQLHQCVEVFKRVRKARFDLLFQHFDLGRLSTADVKRLEWDVLEKKIVRWTRAARFCFQSLFANEKKLCERIFAGLGNTPDDAYFTETVEEHAIQLLDLAAVLSTCRKSPERLSRILDLHEALSGLLPVIDHLFQSDSFRIRAVEMVQGLSKTARGILLDVQNTVLQESSTGLVPGGTVHSMTEFVMNFLTSISDHEKTLMALIMSKPPFADYPHIPDAKFLQHDERTSLALNLSWIIVVLQFNLEGKSKHYKDASLAHLFIMNNFHYINWKIKLSPKLREIIGDDYLKKLTVKFRQAATCYERSTWGRVLDCLRDEGLRANGTFSSGVSKRALRHRFNSFNALFEEVHRTQATWLIPDAQLREELRISISGKLIPAYRSFLDHFRVHLESGRLPETCIKYSAEYLETSVFDLFEGLPISQK